MRRSLVALTIAMSAWSTAVSADVLIGVVGPVTGQYAAFFEQMKHGAEAAAADINAAGGINGQKVQLVIADDACDPKQAVAVANRLVGQRVAAVIGHFCSSSSIPASDVYAENQIPMITPASTNPKLTERGLTNVFRMCGRDDQQAIVAADQILKRKLGKKIAIIHDKSTYGRGIADGVKAHLNTNGVQEALFDAINQGDKDFSAIVSRMKAADVDFVFFGGYHTEAGLLVRQARDQGFNARMMGGDGIATSEFTSIAGPAGDGFLFTFYPDPRENKNAAELVKRFRSQKYEPEGFTIYTYAAVATYAEAANRSKTIEGPKVTAELHKGSFDTLLGKITYDHKGDPNSEPFTVYVWNNGKYGYF